MRAESVDFIREADPDDLVPEVVLHGGRHRVYFELGTYEIWLDVDDARDFAEQLTVCAAEAQRQELKAVTM